MVASRNSAVGPPCYAHHFLDKPGVAERELPDTLNDLHESSMNRPSAIRLPASLLIFFVLLVGLGCKDGGCGKKADTIPETPEARVEQMTGKLPPKTDTVIIADDLEAMRTTLNTLKSRLPNTGIVESMQKQVQNAFGVDLLDAESWKRAGIAPNSSAVVAVHRSRLIFLLYVENRQAFEKTLVDKAKAAFGIEAVTKSEKVGEYPIKILSDDPAAQIAWMYQGKLAIVSMPALDRQGALEDGSAKLVLSDIADTKKDASIWADKGFQAFRETLVAKNAVSMFANPKASVSTQSAKEKMEEDPRAKAVGEWVKKNVTFMGAGIGADDKQATVKAYLGLTPEVLKNVKVAQQTGVQHDWNAYATEKMMLGLRFSVNVPKTYDLVLEAMGEEERRSARRNLKMIGDQYSIDIEKEVFDQLAGHVGVFFYGIAGGNPMALMAVKNPLQASSQLGLLGVLKFKSKEALDGLVGKIIERSAGAMTVRPLVHDPENTDFKVLAPAQGSFGNLYVYKDQVAFATTAFGDEAMQKYLTNNREEKKLGELEKRDLGEAFASNPNFSGLYFNPDRAKDNLGPMLAMGGISQILDSIEEASLSLDADDRGAFAQLTVDLTPAPAGAQGGDKPAPTDGKPK